jgi:hypothetical protein
MTSYNYFGATSQDIIDGFVGVSYANFDQSGGDSDAAGQAMVLREMGRLEQRIVERMGHRVLRLLDVMPLYQLTDDQLVVVDSTATYTPLVAAQQASMQIYSYDNIDGCDAVDTVTSGLCDKNYECGFPICESDMTEVTYTTPTSGTFSFEYDETRSYWATYEADKTSLLLGSLKQTLIDGVRCRLGHQLYSRQGDSWSLLDIYCEDYRSALERIDRYFLPPELARQRYLNWSRPRKSGIKVGRFYRA